MDFSELDAAAKANLPARCLPLYHLWKAEMINRFPYDLEFVEMCLRGWIWDEIEESSATNTAARSAPGLRSDPQTGC
jgi:hypothetical protein